MSEINSVPFSYLLPLFWEVMESLTSFSLPVVIALSLFGTISGVMAFRQNKVAIAKENEVAGVGRTLLYWISLLPSVLWYAILFFPQIRFPSLLDGLSEGKISALAIGILGAIVFVWCGLRALRVIGENSKATGKSMVDFLQPSQLLIKGDYAKVRHPMFLYDFLAHSGLAVAAGALTTIAILPLYFLLGATFNLAEERWVLGPRFGKSFYSYRDCVPGYMTLEAGVVLSLLAVGVGVTLDLAS